jgi:hypothetical protein
LIFYQFNVFTARSERTGQIVYDGLFVQEVKAPVDKRPNQPVSFAVDDEDYVDGDFLCDDTSYGSDVVLFHSPNLAVTSASDEVDFGDDEVDNETNCSAIPCEVVSYIGPKEEFPR